MTGQRRYIHDDATGVMRSRVDNHGQHHDDGKAESSSGCQEGENAGGVGDDDTDSAKEFGHTNKENEASGGFFGPIKCGAGFGGLEGFAKPSHPKNKRQNGLCYPQGNMHTVLQNPASAWCRRGMGVWLFGFADGNGEGFVVEFEGFTMGAGQAFA